MLRGSIPPTGIPMPFISACGTLLSVFMGAIGILCNVGKVKENGCEFGNYSFKINLFQIRIRKNNKDL